MRGNSCFDAFLLGQYVAEKVYRPSSDKYVRPTRQSVEIKNNNRDESILKQPFNSLVKQTWSG